MYIINTVNIANTCINIVNRDILILLFLVSINNSDIAGLKLCVFV